MQVTNLLDIHTRQELYQWYLDNHDKVPDFWLRINRAEYAEKTLQKFIQDCHNGKMQSGWSDFGRN